MEAHERKRQSKSQPDFAAAEDWQKAQAWATWEKIEAGDVRETSLEELRAIVSEARRSVARRRPRST